MSLKPRFLDPVELNRLYRYDPEKGHIILKEANRRSAAGHVYTARAPNSYIQVTYKKGTAPAHRIAWVLMTGEQPDYIDHINGARHDNRWSNLRSGTLSDNMRNKAFHRIARGEPGPFDTQESEYAHHDRET